MNQTDASSTPADAVFGPAQLSRDESDWAELVRAVQCNEPDSMSSLYDALGPGIRLFLFRRLGPEDAEDRLNEIFLSVVQAIQQGRVRQPGRLAAFVHGVVRYQAATHIGVMAWERRRRVQLDAAPWLADLRGSPEDEMWSRQRSQIMMLVLGRLRPKDREILTRFYLNEETQEVICRDMHLTNTQFRLLKSRAKARLEELGRKQLCRGGHKAGHKARPALTHGTRVTTNRTMIVATALLTPRVSVTTRSKK